MKHVNKLAYSISTTCDFGLSEVVGEIRMLSLTRLDLYYQPKGESAENLRYIVTLRNFTCSCYPASCKMQGFAEWAHITRRFRNSSHKGVSFRFGEIQPVSARIVQWLHMKHYYLFCFNNECDPLKNDCFFDLLETIDGLNWNCSDQCCFIANQILIFPFAQWNWMSRTKHWKVHLLAKSPHIRHLNGNIATPD